MIMRGGRLERFVLIPFSIRCDSESSVALAVSASAAAATTTLSPKHSKTRGIKGGEEKLKMNIKNQTMSKAALISEGLYRLLRRFKSFSQLFVYKEEMEEMEKEMEIGFPTDVKHVTHIGLDGSTTTVNSLPNWENLKATEILSFPSSISLQQFELAMAAQSRAPIEIN